MSTNPKLVRDLFLAVTELPVAEQATYLENQTQGDAELLAAVQRLLAAHEQPASVLNQSAPGMPTADYAGPAERLGTMIGPYKLMEQIGEGGFGLVFVAEQSEPVKRRVALKIIKPGMDSSQVIARFEAERQALAMMDHPNIARVLDAGTTPVSHPSPGEAAGGGRPYFVMELVRGIPITEYCDQNHLTPDERLELFVSVCHAIQHAHQKGIIHRDIKPSNVLVASHDGKPVAKVIDFGVAKAIHQHLTERTIYTQFAQMIGTPLYMSPEQAEMSGLDIDTRSDIYSLGVLLYELLTGSTPLERDKLMKAAYDEIRRAIREDDPQRPSDRLSASKTLPSLAASRRTEPTRLSRMLKGELDWIVMKALDKDRTRRYESANGLARDIQRYLSDDVVEARPATTGYRLRKFVKRYRGQVLAAGLVLGALILGIIGTTWGLIEARKQRSLAQEAQLVAVEKAEGERQAKEKAVQEATKASQQAEIAEAVKKFLEQDLIGQADPHQDSGEAKPKDVELKLKTALDRAVPLIEERFKGKPLIEASLRRTLSKAYEGRGLYSEAQVQLAKACELYRQEWSGAGIKMKGFLDVPLVQIHLELIMLCHIMGEKQKALTAIQALEDQLLTSVKESAERKAILEPMRLLRDVVEAKDTKNAFLKAQELLRTALEEPSTSSASKTTLGKEGTSFVEFSVPAENPFAPMNSLFEHMQLIKQGKLTQAEQALKKQLDGEQNPHLRMLLITSLADVYQRQGRSDEAERALLQLIESERAKGESQLLFLSHVAFADMCKSQGKRTEARKNYEIAYTGLKKVSGEDHPLVANCQLELAKLLLSEKKYSEAEMDIKKALIILEKQILLNDPSLFEAKSLLGASLLGQKKYNEAEPMLLSGYQGLARQDKRDHSEDTMIPEALDRLITFYTETNKPDEVKKWQAEKDKLPKPEKK
jgi:serine/threonine protein kinase/tetratricopeptide (TPR) repeat protein